MSWTAARVNETLAALRVRRGDSTSVEVKRAAGGLPANLARTVCAFANMPDGGTILLGVDEADNFVVTGVSDPAALEAGVVSQARDTVIPVPHLLTSNVEVDGKQVVIVEVAPLRLADRPATVEGRAYLRQSDGDYVMHEHELRMIEVEKVLMATPMDYDRQVVPGLSVDDLVPAIVEQYLASARSRDARLRDRSDDDVLRYTGVIVRSGEPTLAGLYAMGDYPQGQFPSLTVTAAVQVYGDAGGVRNRDLRHFTGPVPVLLEECMDWCRRNLSLVRAYRTDGHMVERPEIPLAAVRELLANALVHRDLSPNTLGTGKGVQIRLTSSNLFILSPGGLRGVSLQQLESDDHAQAAVNQRLYSIAQKLTTADGAAVIEGEGGGLREVFRAARDYGLRPPTLINTGVQFKALLWRPDSMSTRPPARQDADREGSDVQATTPERTTPEQAVARHTPTKNEPAVIDVLADRGAASIRELQSATGLTMSQVRYALARPLEAGLVEMDGSQGRQNTVYRLKKSVTISADSQSAS